MTEITSPPPLYSSASPTSAKGLDDKGVLSSDFDTFLKMLTVQVQNQDPLNPVDSTDYATQLATFSSVEQQVLTNDLLREVSASLTGNALQELSSWIGMEALVRAPVLFTGTPIAVRPEFAEDADAATLVVRDGNGDAIQRFDLDLSQDEVYWTGTDDTGTALPAGIYKFEVESYKDEAKIDTIAAQAYSRVAEVRQNGETLVLRMADGTELDPGQIDGLRAPMN
ncbi:flagellar hook capping FlgD N-terminal domain-containing protein [uncultured Mameliella sp.]|uniref:flagellar hook capping FlgD N-terminal domain-containing protein n=1 Tax=uncultured Mameliella sp. TaxID=1447087 RepID=UPI002623036C|nr:flagellar hook capping FlgD N-terminal domain-containing protein [uncultured Mameliella sp.]